MSEKDTNTEKAILDAAEQVFLEKGYAAAKTTEIARIARVNHAMLHYYFRTKENLFNKVFEEKAHLLASSFYSLFDQDLPFVEIVRQAVGGHFDFLVANPRLPMFVIGEILTNEERREQVKRILMPKLSLLYASIQKAIDREVEAGRMKPALAVDCMLNVVSLNLFTIVMTQIISYTENGLTEDNNEDFLKHRRENIIQLILTSLGL